MRRSHLALLALAAAVLALPGARQVEPLPCVDHDLQLLVQPDNDARAEVVRSLLTARGLTYQEQGFDNPHPGALRRHGTNIIVDTGSGARDIVVGAHFDAAATSDGITPGALDNGAGVVVLQRLAQSLREQTLRHRVRVVFFDMEEIGLLGSQHYAGAAEPGRTAAMVNVDVVGTGETIILGPSSSLGNDALYAATAVACTRTSMGCLRFPNYPPSDDLSFEAVGIPNVSVGMLPRLQADQLWMRLNGGHATGRAPGERPRVFTLIHTRDDVVAEVEPLAVTLAHQYLLALVLELDAALPLP